MARYVPILRAKQAAMQEYEEALAAQLEKGKSANFTEKSSSGTECLAIADIHSMLDSFLPARLPPNPGEGKCSAWIIELIILHLVEIGVKFCFAEIWHLKFV